MALGPLKLELEITHVQYLDWCLDDMDPGDHEATRTFHLAYFAVCLSEHSAHVQDIQMAKVKTLRGVEPTFG